MAEQERKTKAERRAEARAERKRAEEAAARKAKQTQVRNVVIAVAVIGVIALIMIPAASSLFGGGPADDTISQAAALEARQTAGCTMDVDDQPLPDSTHHDPATAPPADVLYAQSTVRPTHSGPHFAQQNPIIGGVPDNPLDERALTHNLEHGSIVVYYDAAQVDDDVVGEMESWMQDRQDAGFVGGGQASVFVTPYENFQGSDKPYAIRAWGYALNCDEWSQDVADAMIIDYWGTHGRAPERNLAPYPAEALGYEETEVEDNTEAPIENESDAGPLGSEDAEGGDDTSAETSETPSPASS